MEEKVLIFYKGKQIQAKCLLIWFDSYDNGQTMSYYAELRNIKNGKLVACQSGDNIPYDEMPDNVRQFVKIHNMKYSDAESIMVVG